MMPETSEQKKFIIITTIGEPTDEILSWMESYIDEWSIVIVGDKKTPDTWQDTFVEYLSVDKQNEIFPKFSSIAPFNHYSRKNIGYLYAMSQGADLVLETDDDNFPYKTFGKNISRNIEGRLVGGEKWVNIYKHFSDANIWPRGLPLDAIYSIGEELNSSEKGECPIQQYLVDDDPDVDAIWRLVFNSGEVTFDSSAKSVILDKGSWVPFNSQNTLFYKDAFPLLYLPHHVSFRMTDIWRSFVAQAALWVHGANLAFHTSTAKQVRNQHNLMLDFEQEVPGYLSNRKICSVLAKLVEKKSGQQQANLSTTARDLWLEMINIGIVPEIEKPLIEGWFEHLS